jgi:GNAT superfamily N-acetyltransferase
VDQRLSAALAFDRGVRVRGAARVERFPGGVVVRHDGLPMLHHLNAVLLDAPLAAELRDAVPALADERLDGVDHRHVVLDDADAAQSLAPELLAAGWSHQRVVFMCSERGPDHRPRPGVAREIDDSEAHALQHELLTEDAPARRDTAVVAALADQLVVGQEAVRAGTHAKCFAAGEDGDLRSMCTLFLADGIAMIDEVGTLRDHRGRGLARAVVTAALEAARRQGCHEIIVCADADDWPQLMYAKLGFEPLGMQVSFTRSVGSAG